MSKLRCKDIKKNRSRINFDFFLESLTFLVLLAEVAVFAAEFVHTTGGVNQLHLTGEEGV